jgi:YgiT-type zinc finger domain-containing protein
MSKKKSTDEFGPRWSALSQELSKAMAEWRQAHPRATLREIEAAMDEQLARIRARMIEDMVATSFAQEWDSAPEAHPPKCPQCGEPLKPHGKKTRKIQTIGGEDLHLERTYGVCPACGTALFPPRR